MAQKVDRELLLLEKLETDFEELAELDIESSTDAVAGVGKRLATAFRELEKLPLSQTVQKHLKQILSLKGVTHHSLGQAVRSEETAKWVADVIEGPIGHRQDILVARQHLREAIDDLRSELGQW